MNNAAIFIIAITVVHLLLMTFIINFISLWPFCKAYCIYKSDVYKQDLYRQIQDGSHKCNVNLRKLVNLSVVCVQLATIISELLYLDSNFEFELTLERMVIIQCGDNNLNIAN